MFFLMKYDEHPRWEGDDHTASTTAGHKQTTDDEWHQHQTAVYGKQISSAGCRSFTTVIMINSDFRGGGRINELICT